MNDDFRVATGLLAGSKKARRSFLDRFQDAAHLAYDHCRIAAGLGLGFDEYFDGVAESAARSLLSSLPSTPEDGSLDPHVTRVLRHRDFALALLLRRDHPPAWDEFRERFAEYVRSVLLRAGHAAEDADREVEDVIADLRATESDGRRPVHDYNGCCDLNIWLFAFVRARAPRSGPVPAAPRSEIAIVPAGWPDGLEPEVVRATAREVFEEAWAELEEEDAALIAALATGATYLPDEEVTAPEARLARHRDLFESLFLRVRDETARRLEQDPAAFDEWIQDLLIGDLVRELMPICGRTS